jgi:hypothetical protein
MASVTLPVVASLVQDKPIAAESGGVGAAAHCESKILELGYTAVAVCESATASRLAERHYFHM